MYEIILGRNQTDKKKLGIAGTIMIGKHYVTMERTQSLANPILLDINRPHVILVSGKRGEGKCLEENTLITLSNGQVTPIKDLNQNERDVLTLYKDLKIGSTNSNKFYKRKVNRLLHLKFRSGREIKLTPEHPLLTIFGWQPAKELSIGSRIATPRRLPCFGNKELSEHKIKLFAYLIAKGCLREGLVLFSNSDNKILADFNKSVKEFDSNLRVDKHSKSGCYRVSQIKKQYIVKKSERDSKGRFITNRVTCQKSSVNAWLRETGLCNLTSLEKFVPSKIFTLPKYQLALFLNRLFSCDGSLYQCKTTNNFIWEISYSSSSERLIKQVQHLLLRFGVLSKIRQKNIKYKGKLVESFELLISSNNVEKFIEEIGFFGAKQRLQKKAITDLAEIKRNPNLDTIPKEILKIYQPENWAETGRALNYKIPKSLIESKKYAISRQKLMQIALTENNIYLYQLATSDIFWDEISEINDLNGEFTVYDISVPEHHNFIANNIIVHNSYTLGVIAEGISTIQKDIAQNMAVLIFDTMGIYWSMKYPNFKDDMLLRKWKLDPSKLTPTTYVPIGLFDDYQKKGIPVDRPFAIKPSDVNSSQWCEIFGIDFNSNEGILIDRTIRIASEKYKENFSVDQLIKIIQEDKRSSNNELNLVLSRFESIAQWNLFDENATPFEDIIQGGKISIIDLSAYSQIENGSVIRALVVGFLARKILQSRLLVRKEEELKMINEGQLMLNQKVVQRQDNPLIWMLIDEAHEFLPKEGKTLASHPLIQLIREGRQPGVSMVLATQQPGKIHTDVMTQSDILISHRLTAKLDINALNDIMQSYLEMDIQKYIDNLPRVKGSAIALDDNSEKIFPIQVRPRFSWHGGEDPSAILGKVKEGTKIEKD